LSTWQGPRTWQGHDCRVQGAGEAAPCMSCP
jgi:hypothetical protein